MGSAVQMDIRANEVYRWNGRLGHMALRTSRTKSVLQEAAGIRYQEGAEKLIINKKGSGEEYTKRILVFLEEVRAEKRRKVKEEVEKTNWNMSARVF